MFESPDALKTLERARHAAIEEGSTHSAFLAARRRLASGDATIVEVEQAQTAWLRRQHLCDGLRDLAARQERDALAPKIAKLQREHDRLEAILPELRRNALDSKPNETSIAGVGSEFGNALREAKRHHESAWSSYESTNTGLLALQDELAALIDRRDAIVRDYPDAFADADEE